MNKIKIKLLNKKCKPIKGSEKAACFDVFAASITKVKKNSAIVRLGFSATPPEGYKIVLVPRSSITNSFWFMQNSPGQGDEDFTGEYIMKFKCIPNKIENTINDPFLDTKHLIELEYDSFPYKVGERIGQMYLEKVNEFEFEEVEELETTERGEGGFGSTGK